MLAWSHRVTARANFLEAKRSHVILLVILSEIVLDTSVFTFCGLKEEGADQKLASGRKEVLAEPMKRNNLKGKVENGHDT